MRLSPKDFDRLQRAILALHECRAVTTFKQALPAILLSLVPADLFYLMEFEHSQKTERVKMVSVIDPAQQIKPAMALYIEGTLHEHPIAKHFAQTGETIALKLSDFYATKHHLQATEFYERFYGPLGVVRKITIPAIMGPHHIGAIALCNQRKDFTERDRLILNLLRPHIDLARQNAELMAGWPDASARPLADYGLTPRETEIARWLALGKTNADMAIILGSPVRTVEKHVENIFIKLGVENRATAAVLIAAERTLISPEFLGSKRDSKKS
jgi:DNA-binding CsgD family transcriptional regulator